MEPLIAAIGAVLLGALRAELAWQGLVPGTLAFWAGTGAASFVALLLGRFVLPRLRANLVPRTGTVFVLVLQGAVLALGELPAGACPAGGLHLAAGLLPGLACYLALAAGSHGKVGKPGGFAFRDWAALRLYLLPQLVVVLAAGVFSLLYFAFPGADLFLARQPLAPCAVVLIVSGALAALLPFGVRLLFPSRRMTGPLADRLDLLARRAGVRYRAVYLWETRTRRVSTACVTGFFSWNRCIFLTDGLLRALDADEMEAVFAHELSHVRCRHLPMLLALLAGGIGLYLGAAQLLLAGAAATWKTFVPLLVLGAFFRWPFAGISRILELEADLVSLSWGATPLALIRAFRKLRSVSPKAHTRHGWRHYSIPYRIRAIEAWGSSERFRLRFRRTKRAAVAAVFLILAGGGFCFVASGACSFAEPDLAGAWVDRALCSIDRFVLRQRVPQTRVVLERAEPGPSLLAKAEEELRAELAGLQQSAVSLAASARSPDLAVFALLAGDRAGSLGDPGLRLVEVELRRAACFRLLARVLQREGRRREALRAFLKAELVRRAAQRYVAVLQKAGLLAEPFPCAPYS